jgi:catechol 2,3-dioxygenase-like lactoylglutathione lyase family enzyme
MNFRMSSNVAVSTGRLGEAVDFYSTVLGFTERSVDSDLAELDTGPLKLYIVNDEEIAGFVMELSVDDLEAARDELLSHGCEVVRWRGKGKDCYIRDPFGTVFNLWEEPEAG